MSHSESFIPIITVDIIYLDILLDSIILSIGWVLVEILTSYGTNWLILVDIDVDVDDV